MKKNSVLMFAAAVLVVVTLVSSFLAVSYHGQAAKLQAENRQMKSQLDAANKQAAVMLLEKQRLEEESEMRSNQFEQVYREIQGYKSADSQMVNIDDVLKLLIKLL